MHALCIPMRSEHLPLPFTQIHMCVSMNISLVFVFISKILGNTTKMIQLMEDERFGSIDNNLRPNAIMETFMHLDQALWYL